MSAVEDTVGGGPGHFTITARKIKILLSQKIKQEKGFQATTPPYHRSHMNFQPIREMELIQTNYTAFTEKYAFTLPRFLVQIHFFVHKRVWVDCKVATKTKR